MVAYSKIRYALNGYIFRVTGILAIGAFTFGYDLNWWGAMIAHPYFNAVFGDSLLPLPGGLSTRALSATQQSVSTGIGSLGTIIGTLCASYAVQPYGFRPGMVLAAIIVLFGSAIQITCSINGDRFYQMVGGKLITTIAVGMNGINIPVYLSNISPAPVRGAMINTYTTVVALGAVVASGTVYALAGDQTAKTWLIPVGVQFITPLLTIATIGMIPENPHWLLLKERIDDARIVYGKLNPSFSDEQLEAEIAGVVAVIRESKTRPSRQFWLLWKGTDLKRTLAVTGIFCFNAGQGLNFLLGYMATLLVQLGIPNVFQILLIVYTLVTVLSFSASFYQDVAGRRLAMLCGAAGMFICMFGFATLFTVIPMPTGAAANAGIAFIMLWFVSFTLSWYTLGITAAVELSSIPLRGLTLAIANTGSNCVSLLIVFVSPYLQNPGYANLGPKIGYVYGTISACAFIFVYYMVPELQGRTLAEVDMMFDKGVPVRQMKNYTITRDDEHHPDVEESCRNAADLVAEEKGGAELVENVASLPLIR